MRAAASERRKTGWSAVPPRDLSLSGEISTFSPGLAILRDVGGVRAVPLQPAVSDAVRPTDFHRPSLRGGVAVHRNIPSRLQPDCRSHSSNHPSCLVLGVCFFWGMHGALGWGLTKVEVFDPCFAGFFWWRHGVSDVVGMRQRYGMKWAGTRK
jgi:hypothetical protein